MSGNHHQQIFGQPDYANRPASGNLSGSDHLDMLNAADFYEDRTFSTQHLQPLQIPLRDGYRSDQHRLYTAHSNSVPRTASQYSSSNVLSLAGNLAQPYPQNESIQGVLESLDDFSTITPSYSLGAYRTTYPDSNETSTPSTRSPDPTHAIPAMEPAVSEADEDKRKRNQAASARFRQKKKQREQQLVESSRDMQERTKALKAENEGLKKENDFLKKLLVEKVTHMCSEDRELLKKALAGALNEGSSKGKTTS